MGGELDAPHEGAPPVGHEQERVVARERQSRGAFEARELANAVRGAHGLRRRPRDVRHCSRAEADARQGSAAAAAAAIAIVAITAAAAAAAAGTRVYGRDARVVRVRDVPVRGFRGLRSRS